MSKQPKATNEEHRVKNSKVFSTYETLLYFRIKKKHYVFLN